MSDVSILFKALPKKELNKLDVPELIAEIEKLTK